MPDYGHGIKEQDRTSTSYYACFRHWLQIKKYQYEVTFSLYMLTPTEKLVFNVIILVLLSLLVTAAVAYLPDHLVVISNRLWYYVHGESLFSTKAPSQSPTANLLDKVGGLVRSVTSAATRADSVVVGRGAKETAEEVVRQMHEL